MIETAYGRGAYFEYIRTRQSKTQEEHQALLGITFNQQMDNMAYYPPASEIFFNRGEQQRTEPSTLTGVSYADTTDDTLAGLEGMMAMAHGSPDYSSFHEHVSGWDDMVLSPTVCVDDFDRKGSDEKQPEKEENSGSETNRVGPAVSRTVPNQKVGLIENLSSETTDSEESNEVKEATTEADETPFQQKGINVEKQSTKSPEQKSTTDKREIQGDGTREIEKSEGEPTDKVDSYHVKVPNYDIDSYEQSVGDNTTICTGCDNTIEKKTTMYTSRNCTNIHVLCLTCMTDPEDETLMAAQCRHGVFDEMDSYEACVGGTYSFMNKGKPMKQCSSCGEAKKPTNSKPIYYCRKCHLHRVCLDCWTKENLREQETK
jgi:hypothetical protein